MADKPEFIVLSIATDATTRDNNLLSSPDLKSLKHPSAVTVLEPPFDFTPKMNALLQQFYDKSEYLVLAHPDVYLPEGWFLAAKQGLEDARRSGPYFVAGAVGVEQFSGRKRWFGRMQDREAEIGERVTTHKAVQSLDECLVILPNDRRWDLDESLMSYHLWAAELCYRVRANGGRALVLPKLYLEHRSQHGRTLDDPAFYVNLGVLWNKYQYMAPIATTCVTLWERDGRIRMEA